jgi:hypothetical protein
VNLWIEESANDDGPLVSFGPLDSETGWQLAIPSHFTRLAGYVGSGITMKLQLEFRGDKIELKSLEVRREEGSLSSRDLTQLALPKVIRQIAASVIPEAQRWDPSLMSGGTVTESDPSRSNLVALAQLYWYEHVTWGSPRGRLMELWGISRPWANTLIKKAGLQYPLPGAHAGGSVGR